MRNRLSMHDQCLELLPWFVNGTANAEQRLLVEQHTAQCNECALDLESQLQLQMQLRDGDSVMLAPQSSWQKMSERLDGEEKIHARVQRKNAGYRGWRFAAIAQAAVIAGLAIVLWQNAVRTPSPTAAPTYETLTSDVDAPIASRASGAEFRVVFQRDVPIAQINNLLQTLPAQIISGPTEAGVYLLALPPERGDAAAKLLTQLREDHRVIFAEQLNLIEYKP